MNVIALFAVALPTVLALLVLRHVKTQRLPRATAVAVVVLVAALGADLVGFDVAAPGDPIATVTLAKDGSAELPAVGSDAVIVVDGAFSPAEHGAGAVEYTIDVAVAGGTATSITGHFEQHTERRRVGRRGSSQVLVAHTERTHALPAAAIGKAVTLKLSSVSGPLAGPIHVMLRKADPPLAWVGAAAGVLLLFAVVLLRGQLRKLVFPPIFAIAATAVYAALLENGAHPPSFGGLFVVAVAAAMMAAAVAAAITLLPVFARTKRQVT